MVHAAHMGCGWAVVVLLHAWQCLMEGRGPGCCFRRWQVVQYLGDVLVVLCGSHGHVIWMCAILLLRSSCVIAGSVIDLLLVLSASVFARARVAAMTRWFVWMCLVLFVRAMCWIAALVGVMLSRCVRNFCIVVCTRL